MKRYSPEKKSTIYVQTTLKKNKTEKFQIETGAGQGSRAMEKENIVEESKPATFSTLGKEQWTRFNKHVKEMALCCSIYDVYFG